MGPGKEESLLLRATIDDIIKEIRSHSAIVQQGVSFCSSAITDNALTLVLCINQKLQQMTFRFLDLFAKRKVALQLVKPAVSSRAEGRAPPK